jgi:hypothetical protein
MLFSYRIPASLARSFSGGSIREDRRWMPEERGPLALDLVARRLGLSPPPPLSRRLDTQGENAPLALLHIIIAGRLFAVQSGRLLDDSVLIRQPSEAGPASSGGKALGFIGKARLHS